MSKFIKVQGLVAPQNPAKNNASIIGKKQTKISPGSNEMKILSYGIYDKKDEKPAEVFTSEKLLTAIQSESTEHACIQICQEKDKHKRNAMKSKLPKINFCKFRDNFILNERFLGSRFIHFDIDMTSNLLERALRERKSFGKHVYLAFRSCTGRGWKIWLKLDSEITSVCQYHDVAHAFAIDLKRFLHVEVDTACFSPSLGSYISYDKDFIHNENCIEYPLAKVLKSIAKKEIKAYVPMDTQDLNQNQKTAKFCLDNLSRYDWFSWVKIGFVCGSLNMDAEFLAYSSRWSEFSKNPSKYEKEAADLCEQGRKEYENKVGIGTLLFMLGSDNPLKYEEISEQQYDDKRAKDKEEIQKQAELMKKYWGLPEAKEPVNELYDAAMHGGWIGIAKYAKENLADDKIRFNFTLNKFDAKNENVWVTDNKREALTAIGDKLLNELIEIYFMELGKEKKEEAERQAKLKLLAENNADAAIVKDCKKETDKKKKPSEVINDYINALKNPNGRETFRDAFKDVKGIGITEDEYDSDIDSINLSDGLYDLRTGIYKNVGYFRKKVNVHLNTTAQCPEWGKFINKILRHVDDDDQEDIIKTAEKINFLQKFLGLGLSGVMLEKLVIMYGKGANGKSTMMEAIHNIIGSYMVYLPMKCLYQNDGNAPNYELAGLMGKRMAVFNEAKENWRLEAATVKNITSKDQQTQRQIRQESVTFTPTHKTVILSNYLPIITENDHGLWRRLCLLKFSHNFNSEPENLKSDFEVQKMFKSEREGIFNWLYQGYLKAMEDLNTRGELFVPGSIAGDTAEFRDNNDATLKNIHQIITEDPKSKLQFKDFHCEYNKKWMTDNRALAKEMKDRGIIIKPGHGNIKYIIGWRFKEPYKSSEDLAQEYFKIMSK